MQLNAEDKTCKRFSSVSKGMCEVSCVVIVWEKSSMQQCNDKKKRHYQIKGENRKNGITFK